MCLRPCEHIRVLLMCAGPLVCSVLQTARRRGKKKRESLNVTLLSTVTTLATCNVSARISVAHWACAEQAPSPPRAPRKRTRWTRDELGRIPAGGRCNFNHLFFPILCYAECHHSPKLFLLLSSLFALCCPSAITASTASHDGCRSQGAAATKRGVRESETYVSVSMYICVLSPVSTIRDATTGGAVQSVSDKQLSPNSLQHPALVQTGSRSPCFIVPSRADLSATKCAGFS